MGPASSSFSRRRGCGDPPAARVPEIPRVPRRYLNEKDEVPGFRKTTVTLDERYRFDDCDRRTIYIFQLNEKNYISKRSPIRYTMMTKIIPPKKTVLIAKVKNVLIKTYQLRTAAYCVRVTLTGDRTPAYLTR